MHGSMLEPLRLDRRRFLASAGAVAGAGIVSSLASPGMAWANDDDLELLPSPEPIPGGLPVGLPAPFDLIHVFIPGPPSITLPLSGTTLMGLDVEPSPLTDFKGKTALAYVIGSATGSDGVRYGMEVDIRAYEGKYVAADGSTNRGAFALI